MSKDRIQQLIKAVGSMPQTDDSSIECTDFNWNEPRYFSKEQLTKLDIFAQNASRCLSDNFSSFCRTQSEVEIKSISQHYASEFLPVSEDGQSNNYYLSFGSGPGKECGVLEIPEQTAVLWSKQLLGDSESEEEQGKKLSQLEESLLYDLGSVIVNALSCTNNNIESNPSENLLYGQFPVSMNENEEVCRITFSVKDSNSEVVTEASFIIPCICLNIVTGKHDNSHSESAGGDFSKNILEHLESTNMCITANLAFSQFSFEEIMNLQVNDVIMLNKKVDEPVELMVEGHSFGYGWSAKAEGKYAIKIVTIEN